MCILRYWQWRPGGECCDRGPVLELDLGMHDVDEDTEGIGDRPVCPPPVGFDVAAADMWLLCLGRGRTEEDT